MIDPYRMIFTSVVSSLFLLTGVLIYKYIYPKKRINLFILLILISILPIISIFRSGTYQAGDLTLHTAYLKSFFENLQDGIFLPQWAGSLCRSYGCPVFMFQYLTPCYIGSIFHLFGFSFLDSMKLFLASSFILSGITMYIFIKDQYTEISAFIGSLLYIFAPIHLMETHFRVSVGTCAAYIFIPLVFLFSKKSVSGKPHYLLLNSIFVSLLILSHSSITFIVIPTAFLYVFLLRKKISDLLYPLISIMLGFGLMALYVLPALFEVKYTWLTPQFMGPVQGFFPILYYIYSPARYGLLFQGNHGELRLIVGYAQLLVIIISLFYLLTNKFEKNSKRIIIYFISVFCLCFAFMLSFTKVVWDNVFLLKSFILPWRMLVPIAFATSYIGAIVTKQWHKKGLIIFSVFIIGSTILNWGNRMMVPFDPQSYYDPSIWYSEYFDPNNPEYFKIYQQESKIVILNPDYKKKNNLKPMIALRGDAQIKQLTRTQINHEYLINVKNDATFSENTFYFPGWKIYANGNQIPIDIKNKQAFGTLTFTLKRGMYNVKASFEDTQIRKLGKLISGFSLIIFLLILFKGFLFRRRLLS
jgi:hypothetical protein